MKVFAIANIYLLMSFACIFASENVEITRGKSSKVQKVTVIDDTLTLEKSGRVYTFKISELIENYSKVQKPKLQGDWFFFVGKKGNSNSFQYVNVNRRKVFKDGEFVFRFTKDGKYYVKDLDNNIFTPTWEVSKDFSSHLVPAKKYIAMLEQRIKSTEQQIRTLRGKIDENKKKITREREQYISFLRSNNIDTTVVDKNGNIISKSDSGKFDTRLRRQLRLYKKNINERERELSEQQKHLPSALSRLRSLQRLKRKAEALYSKHATNQESA